MPETVAEAPSPEDRDPPFIAPGEPLEDPAPCLPSLGPGFQEAEPPAAFRPGQGLLPAGPCPYSEVPMTRAPHLTNALLWAAAILASALLHAPDFLTLILLPTLGLSALVLAEPRRQRSTCP